MSTVLKPAGNMQLTQYCGNVPTASTGDRRRLQLSQLSNCEGMDPVRGGYVNLSKEDAAELGRALLNWAAGDHPDCLGHRDNDNE